VSEVQKQSYRPVVTARLLILSKRVPKTRTWVHNRLQ